MDNKDVSTRNARDPFKAPLSAPPVEKSPDDRIWEGEAMPASPDQPQDEAYWILWVQAHTETPETHEF